MHLLDLKLTYHHPSKVHTSLFMNLIIVCEHYYLLSSNVNHYYHLCFLSNVINILSMFLGIIRQISSTDTDNTSPNQPKFRKRAQTQLKPIGAGRDNNNAVVEKAAQLGLFS